GGIMWASGNPESKNACSNGPAMILGARIYALEKNESELDFTKKIHDWMAENLVDERGIVWDGYGNHNEGNVYTYNIGTWFG
ncbi:glycoside hydrolase family 76 protein, partial [Streptococcus pyogenes]